MRSTREDSNNLQGTGALLWKSLVQYSALVIVLGLLVLIFGSMSSHFFSVRTLASIANQIPELTVIATGMTLVLIVRGIDLSVGSLLALSSAVLGVLMVDHGWSLWLASGVCLLVGMTAGAVNGLVSFGIGVPSFIVTLGMLEFARGIAYLVTDSQTKYIGSRVESIGAPLAVLNVSPAFLIAISIVAVAHFVLTRTVFGRYCYAIGTNREAVRMSGINHRPYEVGVFVISGLLCAVGGIIQASRLSSADPNSAVGFELAAIAAAVIGGTSLMGGRGSVITTLFGVVIIAVLQTGLAQIGATEPTKRVITGSVIVLAVIGDVYRDRFQRYFQHILSRMI